MAEKRTMRDVMVEYDEKRNRIIQSVKDGKISCSMSSLENYEKPWGDLDINNDNDLHTIAVNLSWDDKSKRFARTMIKKSEKP